MVKVYAYMLNGGRQWLRLGVDVLMLSVFLFLLTGCGKQETNSVRTAKYEDGVSSLSLSGPYQAAVISEKARDLRLTTDAGKKWRVIPADSVGGAFECAFMLNEKWGWAVNHQGQIFSTKSAGESWTRISEIKDFIGAHQIEFLNETDGWLRESLSIWSTRDGGTTWRNTLTTATPGVYGQPSGMFVLDRDKVVASGSDGQVYLTRDAGETWKIQTPVPGNVSFNDVWFVDSTHGWLIGYEVVVAGEKLRALLLETNDGGDSWRELPMAVDLIPSSICVVGEEWWLAGNVRTVNGQSINLAGVLLHSRNRGKDWNEIRFASDEPVVQQVRVTDNEHGWLVAGDGLYRTEDAGKTWGRVLSLY